MEQNIVIPGGEIAELPGQVRGVIWNATSVGIVEKDKFIDGSKVVAGDKVIGIRSVGFRSNGFSLVRVLKKSIPEKTGLMLTMAMGVAGEKLCLPQA